MAIEAFDTAFPDMRDRTECLIEVIRNPNPPIFENNFYTETISEEVNLGYFILDVRANDADGDSVTYEMVESSTLNDFPSSYFLVTADGGIFVRSSLVNAPQNQYSFTVRARDHAFPEKFGTTTVQINIVRDQFTPVFTLQNYVITIAETTSTECIQPILTVSATDNDLQGRIVYVANGDGSALSYFNISQSGAICVISSLRQDSQPQYIMSLAAFDSVYPFNAGVARVTINVVRNPNPPVFSLPSYQVTINENFPLGGVVVDVDASDNDGDFITYRFIESQFGLAQDYFLVNFDNGEIYLRQELRFNQNVNRYSMIVQAQDNRGQYTRYSNVTVTVIVLRNQSPFFISEPYRLVISERADVATSLYQVTANDNDLIGEIVYTVLGDIPAPSYFTVDANTGVISATNDLMLDNTINYRLRVGAYDSVIPYDVATSTVSITVLRNDNEPIFLEEPYQLTLSESTVVGTSVYRITANDADGDIIRYSMLDVLTNEIAVDHFYLHPDTGEIYLTNSLTDFTLRQISISVRASDQRVPERVDDSVVVIDILRDQFPPIFNDEPYIVSVTDNQPLNVSIFQVNAFDQDLRGDLMYESIGLYPAQSFFSIGALDGRIFTRRSLKEDGIARESYVLRVIVYDSVDPRLQDTADVTINVARNPSVPQWSQARYQTTVSEEYSMGIPVLTVLATDSDGDSVSYQMIGDSIGSNSGDYFFINSASGDIFLRRSLTEAPVNQYQFTVRATDSGRPPRSTNIEVTVFIVRAQLPTFINQPYITTVQENSLNNSQIYTVTAVDQDGQGQMMYEIIGTGAAPSFFYIDNTGRIYTRGQLRTDRALTYILRVIGYDSLTPYQQATADVTITVLRNVNSPQFQPENYQQTIPEELAVGASILQVTATDADNDFLTFSLSGNLNSRCSETFYIRETTGEIHLARSLINTGDVSFTCTVTVNDNGYPNNNVATANVIIFVTRDTSPPVFTNNALYAVTINENRPIGDGIITVSASRQGLLGRIYYEEIGDYPAQSFFQVQNTSGVVTVSQDLRNDNIRQSTYTLRVVAYDTGASRLTATAEVFITVLRNLNGPIFDPQIYRVTIDEDTAVGQYIQKLTVADPDGDDVTCSVVSESGSANNNLNNFYFGVDLDSCIVYVNRGLIQDLSDRTEYTLTVRASDNRSPTPQSTTATVIVTVLRDLALPRFINLPAAIDLDENAVIGRSVFQVTATDDDLEGFIVYNLIGEFPVQSFFTVNTTTGVVNLRNSLLADTTQNTIYTARFTAYDSVNPMQVAVSELTIRVLRNQNGPVFNPRIYDETIADVYPVGGVVLTVTANDADGVSVLCLLMSQIFI